MDKIAANNHIVVLKKEIKSAKSMVSGNLIRKINKLKQEQQKANESLKDKLTKKVGKIYDHIKLLKRIDTYNIAKQLVLKPDPKYWDKLTGDCRATTEQVLIARIAAKNKVKNELARFRSQHKDCDQWIQEYFEFREKKNDILSKPSKDRKKKINKLKEKSKPKKGGQITDDNDDDNDHEDNKNVENEEEYGDIDDEDDQSDTEIEDKEDSGDSSEG